MIQRDQEKFYAKVGRALQVARQRRNMTITQLEKLSGEHHKTLRGIEAGKPHYAHHAVWMKNILGLDINGILRDMEGGDHGEINGDRGIESFI